MNRFAKPQNVHPPREPEVVAKTLKYGESEEHLVRRLGNALVLQWDCIPDALQDLLIDQAAAVDDRVEAPHTASDLEAFLRSARAIAIRRDAPEDEAPIASAINEAS